MNFKDKSRVVLLILFLVLGIINSLVLDNIAILYAAPSTKFLLSSTKIPIKKNTFNNSKYFNKHKHHSILLIL